MGRTLRVLILCQAERVNAQRVLPLRDVGRFRPRLVRPRGHVGFHMIREAIALATLIVCHGILLTAAVAIVRSLTRRNREE